MHKIKKALFLIFVSFSIPLFADFEQQSIEKLALTFRAFEEKGSDQIWPGFNPGETPAVFHFSNGHLYGFGLQGECPLWEKKLVKGQKVLFCPSHPANLTPLDPSFSIENQKAFIFSLDHENDHSDLPLFTFIHEHFHTHQFKYFKNIGGGRPIAADYQTADQLGLIELENRLLTQYLLTGTKDRLKDYVAVNQSRRMHMHPSSIAWEDNQQRMEGLADYVSVKTFAEFPVTSFSDPKMAILVMREKKTVGSPSLVEDAIKGRHYFVGAVIALALDEMGISWKDRIAEGNISLQKLLENSLGVPTNHLTSIMKQFNWNEIKVKIDLELQQQNQVKEQLLSEFDRQEGIRMSILMPKGPMATGGRHEKSCRIDDRHKILVKDISVSTTQDQTWQLSFKEIPFLIEDQKGNRFFKIDRNLILLIDGEKFDLRQILTRDQILPFTSLFFQNESCELQSNKSGKIIVQDGALTLVFNS